MEKAKCKSCQAPIWFGKLNGKWHPYDTGTKTSHFDTCPNAAQHRTRKADSAPTPAPINSPTQVEYVEGWEVQCFARHASWFLKTKSPRGIVYQGIFNELDQGLAWVRTHAKGNPIETLQKTEN